MTIYEARHLLTARSSSFSMLLLVNHIDQDVNREGQNRTCVQTGLQKRLAVDVKYSYELGQMLFSSYPSRKHVLCILLTQDGGKTDIV